jgi:hypothetical protein
VKPPIRPARLTHPHYQACGLAVRFQEPPAAAREVRPPCGRQNPENLRHQDRMEASVVLCFQILDHADAQLYVRQASQAQPRARDLARVGIDRQEVTFRVVQCEQRLEQIVAAAHDAGLRGGDPQGAGGSGAAGRPRRRGRQAAQARCDWTSVNGLVSASLGWGTLEPAWGTGGNPGAVPITVPAAAVSGPRARGDHRRA